MYGISLVVALIASVGIIAIGIGYVATPQTMAQSFGLPLPDAGANIAWWLRLKGVRDIVSGLVVLAMILWGGPRLVGIVLFIEAFIAVGDMSLILAARGSRRAAFGLHGLTAAVMMLAAAPLILDLA